MTYESKHAKPERPLTSLEQQALMVAEHVEAHPSAGSLTGPPAESQPAPALVVPAVRTMEDVLSKVASTIIEEEGGWLVILLGSSYGLRITEFLTPWEAEQARRGRPAEGSKRSLNRSHEKSVEEAAQMRQDAARGSRSTIPIGGE